jgi:hypothetical protein
MSDHGKIIQMEIPAVLDFKEIEKRLLTGKTGPRQMDMMKEMAETAIKIARPVGIYKVSRARILDGNKTEIDGVVFTSMVLNKLFTGRDTVFPFIVTGGKELMEFPVPRGEMTKQFYLDTIKTLVVANSVKYLNGYIQKTYNVPKTALMNPGEIEDWHISEQHPLFSLFDDVEKRIGVTLTGGNVMKPIKSRSGIIFPDESGFETCQLCIQGKCPGRRCKFEPKLYEYYLGKPAKITK